MKKAYVCPKTRPLMVAASSLLQQSRIEPPEGEGAPVMGNDVKGTAASGRLW